MKEKTISFYNKHYKKFLIIPILLVLLSLAYIGYFYKTTGDFVHRDVSLTGGTSITFPSSISPSDFKFQLPKEFSEVDIRSLSDNSGKQTHLLITTTLEKDKIIPEIEKIIGEKITEENSSIEFTGSSLGKDFYRQLLTAMLFAFLLMALVIFITFGERKDIKIYSAILTLISGKITFPNVTSMNFLIIFFICLVFFYGLFAIKSGKGKLILSCLTLLAIIIFFFPKYFLIWPIAIAVLSLYTFYSAPSIAVITCAFADIVLTVAIVNLMGISISSGGIVAFLMLIGYSVDTDVLLTTRVLKRKGESINHASLSAFKTGITMTLTSIAAVLVALLLVYRYETVLNQIFTILIIGLGLDIFNTWATNVWIIKWYAEIRNKNQ